MQASIQKLSVVFTFLFFAALLASAYFMYHLPNEFVQQSSSVDMTVLKQLNPTLNKMYLVLGISAMLGMINVALLISSRKVASGMVTARDVNHTSEEKQATQEEEQNEELRIDHSAIEEIISGTQEAEKCFGQALSQICKELEASQAAAYIAHDDGGKRWIELFASYAFHVPEGDTISYRFGEGLAGEVAKEGKVLNLDTVPEGYIRILSGLGSATPNHLIILPLKEADKTVGVVEIASFHPFTQQVEGELRQAFDKLALKLANDDNVSLEKAKC